MSEQIEQPKQPVSIKKVDTPAGLSNEMLIEMLVKSQAENAASNKLLAEAILESRKPYVDPRVLEQKEIALKERQAEIKRTAAIRVATKKGCPHVRDNGTSNIKWMEHSNNIVKGVCGSCFSEFDSRSAADVELVRRDPKSVKGMGRAGQHANNRFIGI